MLRAQEKPTEAYEPSTPYNTENGKGSATTTKEGTRALNRWQTRLLPWMVIMPTALIMAFIVLATVRMNRFETFIYAPQPSLLDKSLFNSEQLKNDSISTTQLAYLKLYTLTQMEQYSIGRRYNQAGVITMSTIYTKYLGFFTGMVLAIVGAVFIISKLRENDTTVEGNFSEQVRVKLLSSSPGILFGLLGTILMTITIVNKGEVKVDDAPLYLNHFNLLNPASPYPASALDSGNINRLPTDTGHRGRITPAEANSVDLDQ